MSATIRPIREIDLVREAGRTLTITHEELAEAVRPGISTTDIDRLGEEIIRSYGYIPSFKNYNGYPASICIFMSDEVVHGVPNRKRILQESDIVSLDARVIYKESHPDATGTHVVGEISQEAEKLIEVTRQNFFKGVKYAKPGNHLNGISSAVVAYVERFGYGVVRDLVGHGIGSHLHEDPKISNFPQRGEDIRFQAGMTLAIEPMINAGRLDVEWPDDGWIVVTEDGSLSTRYENTILVCDDDPEILSVLSLDGKSPSPALGEKG